MTKAELQAKLEQANKIIDGLMQQISDLHRQYTDVVTKQEFDGLLKQYEALEQRYKILQSLYDKKQTKKH
jgi:predicted translin family RNA/ssDNA-binding protein